jgi:hypothetical protein
MSLYKPKKFVLPGFPMLRHKAHYEVHKGQDAPAFENPTSTHRSHETPEDIGHSCEY